MVGGVGLPPGSSTANLQFVGRAHVKGRHRWIKHVLVTINLLGLQLVWSTEMAYASPYLLSLGLSKAGMSAVFLAGPLSGLIVQPIIGALADKSKSRFGRRRPVIAIGCLICVVSLLVFGYTGEVASIFTSWGSSAHSTLTIWLAVLAVYALDFAINGVMAADRALIVDVLPASQQEEANAWAARLSGAGSILGFWIGNVDLTGAFGFLGSSQIKILSVFASTALVAAHTVTIFSVEERVLLDDGRVEEQGLSKLAPLLDDIKQIWSTYRTLPLPIWDICKVQAFAWGGWFPILFFSTTYIAEIYNSHHTISTPMTGIGAAIGASPHDTDPGTRAGSRAMFLHSIFAFVMSIVLPFFVSSSASGTRQNGIRKARLSDAHGTYAINWSDSPFSQFLQRLPTIPFPWLDLRLLWAVSHAVFAVLMFSTWIVGSVWSGTLMLTLLGFSWAVTCWAPTSLLAQEILQDGNGGGKPSRANTMEFQAVDYSAQTQIDPDDSFLGGSKIVRSQSPEHNTSPGDNALGLSGTTSLSSSTSSSPHPSHPRTPRPPKEARQPSHPPPLELSKKLRALNSSPVGQSDSLHHSRQTQSPILTTGKTLQIRHSDSYDDFNSVASSDTEDDQDLTPTQTISPLPATYPPPPSQPPTLNRQTSSSETARIYHHHHHHDIDLDGDAAALALEAAYLSGGRELGRTADQAGAILGIANIFVVLPQFITSFISSIVFAFIAPTTSDGSKEGVHTPDRGPLEDIDRRAGVHIGQASDDAIGFVFRVGGVSALVAAWLCWQMRRRKK